MQATSIAADSAGNVYIFDEDRVLVFDNPPAPGGGTPGIPGAAGDTTADVVLGQVNFTQATPNMVDATGLNTAGAVNSLPNMPGVAIDASSTPSHLYVADLGNNRVLGWNDAAGFSNGAPADIVIGQPDFYSSACNGAPSDYGGPFPPTSTSLCAPMGLAVDAGGNLFVADINNARVVEYNAPFKSGAAAGMAANLVFGQNGSFTTNVCGESGGDGPVTADTLCYPAGIAVDSAGDLYVADEAVSRVVEYDRPLAAGGGKPGQPGFPGDTTADRVFGQTSLTTEAFCDSGGPTNARTLCNPAGVAADSSGNLYVADTGDSRVLEYYNPLGRAGDTIADRVFGQINFSGSACSSPAANPCQPVSVVLDGAGNLYVGDDTSNQVFEYDRPGAAGMATSASPGDTRPDLVFGEPSPCNAPQAYVGTADSMCSLGGLALDPAGDLYVVNAGNNRVLAFDQLAAQATLYIAPATVNFGSQAFGLDGATSKPRLITVTNTARSGKLPQDARIESLTASGDFAIDQSNSTCSPAAMLAPGAKCTVALSFTPNALGRRSGQLEIGYGLARSVTAGLSGTGAPPALSYAPRSINFGKVKVGSPANGAVTLTNSNGADLGITALTSSDPKEFTVSQNCVGMLARNGGTCGIAVTFTPVSKGPHNARLAIADDAANSPQTVTLTGTGD